MGYVAWLLLLNYLLNEFTIFESKTNYWINISLLHKKWIFEYETNIFEWKNIYISMKLQGIENIDQEISNENRTTE